MNYSLFDNLSLSDSDDFTDLIPLMSSGDEKRLNSLRIPKLLSILPLRNTVLFPGVVIPITISRDKSIELINNAYKNKKIIGVVSQVNPDVESPQEKDLNRVGTAAKILRLFKMPDGNLTVIIQGQKRFFMSKMVNNDPYFVAEIKPFIEIKPRKNNQNFKKTSDPGNLSPF